MTDLAAHMPAVALALAGKPNKALSTLSELRFGSNGSLSVDVERGAWYDHERQVGGGVLDFIRARKGLEGADAFAWMREIGCDVEDAKPYRNGNGAHAATPAPAPEARPEPKATRVFDATYDYVDENGMLLFQAIRCVFTLPDGSHLKGDGGKRKKTFLQRRPDPERKGEWIWSTKGLRGVPYRLADLIEAIANDQDVYVVEGERKVDALREIGIAATCCAGGAGKWPDHFRDYFHGARVIVLPDNDEAGRKHAYQVGQNIDAVAASNMVLDLPDLPAKGDVVDWLAEGGTADDLAALGAQARAWVSAQPEGFVSRFGLRRWEEIGRAAKPYPWVVENLIPEAESVVIFGQSGSGKSFDSFDLAMCVARGLKFNDLNVSAGLVIYVAAEAGKGFEKRKIAYCSHHGLRLHDPLPFVLLTKRPDLFKDDVDTAALIDEIKAVAATYAVPLRAVFLDTVSALTPGMNENASADVSKVRMRIDRIRDAVQAATILVHHTPKGGGSPRGHGSFTADFETTIAFETVEALFDEEIMPDGERKLRAVHRATVVKQREGRRGFTWDFVLQVVEVGKNQWGNPETSCVVLPRAEQRNGRRGPTPITPQQRRFMEALWKAIELHGVPAVSTALALPRSITRVVDYRHVKAIFARAELNDGDDPRDHSVRLRQALSRSRKDLMTRAFIGTDDPYIWATGRPIEGMAGPQIEAPDAASSPPEGEVIPFEGETS